ncbi:hypothetical protein ECMP0210174_2451 [Escherichia coli MP021017.4]|nr:hypothetical protein ECMP0210174_2451 [Escherichia coli MP021017.4]EMV23807.1 hypothetical protein ECMP02101712_2302 [Escherichia coli MP021017.12]ENB16028.1 hypothetical protein ECBCE008MS01_2318 [Escherichia coli BCE008_MS-01]
MVAKAANNTAGRTVFIFLLSFFIYRFSPMMSLKVNIFIRFINLLYE